MKKRLENMARMLDRKISGLKWKVQRVLEDFEYAS
jgi:hypothetical protein